MFAQLTDKVPGLPWLPLHSDVLPLLVAGRSIADISQAREVIGDVVEPYLEVARASATRAGVKIDLYAYTLDGVGSGRYRVTVYGRSVRVT